MNETLLLTFVTGYHTCRHAGWRYGFLNEDITDKKGKRPAESFKACRAFLYHTYLKQTKIYRNIMPLFIYHRRRLSVKVNIT
jgi:hypothetical protein